MSASPASPFAPIVWQRRLAGAGADALFPIAPPLSPKHLGDGVAYCQIIDAIFPGKMPLHKLTFNSAGDRESRVRNLRLLQKVLDAQGVSKEVPVERLANCKFQDNVEFLQWCYSFLHRTYSDANVTYQAFDRRKQASEGKTGGGSPARPHGGSPHGSPHNSPSMPPRTPGSHSSQVSHDSQGGSYGSHGFPGANANASLAPLTPPATPPYPSGGSGGGGGGGGGRGEHVGAVGLSSPEDVEAVSMLELDQLVSLLEEQLTSRLLSQKMLEEEVTVVRKDRDFYFDALRRVERALCLLPESERSDASHIASDLLGILYASTDAFVDVSVPP